MAKCCKTFANSKWDFRASQPRAGALFAVTLLFGIDDQPKESKGGSSAKFIKHKLNLRPFETAAEVRARTQTQNLCSFRLRPRAQNVFANGQLRYPRAPPYQ